jgi:hypothetical protein
MWSNLNPLRQRRTRAGALIGPGNVDLEYFFGANCISLIKHCCVTHLYDITMSNKKTKQYLRIKKLTD